MYIVFRKFNYICFESKSIYNENSFSLSLSLSLSLLFSLAGYNSFAQNTFPNTGNVGIGTNSPNKLLDVNGKSIFRDKATFEGVLKYGLGYRYHLHTHGKGIYVFNSRN